MVLSMLSESLQAEIWQTLLKLKSATAWGPMKLCVTPPPSEI